MRFRMLSLLLLVCGGVVFAPALIERTHWLVTGTQLVIVTAAWLAALHFWNKAKKSTRHQRK